MVKIRISKNITKPKLNNNIKKLEKNIRNLVEKLGEDKHTELHDVYSCINL